MKLVLAYNVKHEKPVAELASDEVLDFDSWEVIAGLKTTLEELGHSVEMVEADLGAYEKLKGLRGKIDMVFNIAEGLGGDAREAQIPLFCEMLGIPYTHSSPTTHALKLNKKLAKLAVRGLGISVPETVEKWDGEGPVLVKPNKQGSSIGIFDRNVVRRGEDLGKIVAETAKGGKWEVIVEEYIEGREFTVSLLGDEPEVLPIIEQKFDFMPEGMNKIAGFEAKWIYEENLDDISLAYSCPAQIPPEMAREIGETSIEIFRGLNVRDCARIDYRLGGDGKLYFLEINTLPGLNPNPKAPSYFVYSAYKAGMSYKELIGRILDSAVARWGLV